MTEIKSKFLETCAIPTNITAKSFTMVIFGGTGDLSNKKLIPALYHLHQDKLIKKFSILSLGRTQMSDKQYRTLIKRSMPKPLQLKTWEAFSQHLFYQAIDITKPADYDQLCPTISEFRQINKSDNVIYYLATTSDLVPQIIKNLGQKNLCRHQTDAKIIVEKPFGRNLATATRLNENILKEFDEKQVYRIDHYLGKETVQNIMFFRFSNTIFEPLWNRNYIDNIQITVAEDQGIGNRGVFYETAGVIRDIVQNHIMQLISLVAMEPPTGFTADLIRDEKVKLLQAIRPLEKKYILENSCIGQYASYRKEANVSPSSNTPTYFAAKFYVDNWRWADVPFYVRTGKCLSKRTTEIAIEFKHPPLKLLGRICDTMQPNTLIFNIQPQEEINLGLSVKQPGAINQPHPVNMVFNYADAFKIPHKEAYERLLIDCMQGDQSLFARQDEIEATWEVVDPIIKASESQKPPIYKDGSDGPKGADVLIEKDKRKWRKL